MASLPASQPASMEHSKEGPKNQESQSGVSWTLSTDGEGGAEQSAVSGAIQLSLLPCPLSIIVTAYLVRALLTGLSTRCGCCRPPAG